MSREDIQSRREFGRVVGLGALAAPLLAFCINQTTAAMPPRSVEFDELRDVVPKSTGLLRAIVRSQRATGVWTRKTPRLAVQLVIFEVTEEYAALPVYLEEIHLSDNSNTVLHGKFFCLFTVNHPSIESVRTFQKDREYLVVVGEQLFEQAVYLSAPDDEQSVPREWLEPTQTALKQYLDSQE